MKAATTSLQICRAKHFTNPTYHISGGRTWVAQGIRVADARVAGLSAGGIPRRRCGSKRAGRRRRRSSRELRLESKGEGTLGEGPEPAELRTLHSRAIDPWLNVQVGVRHDYRPDPERTHLVGVQGLARYWFEIDGALFLSDQGGVTGRQDAVFALTTSTRSCSREADCFRSFRNRASPWRKRAESIAFAAKLASIATSPATRSSQQRRIALRNYDLAGWRRSRCAAREPPRPGDLFLGVGSPRPPLLPAEGSGRGELESRIRSRCHRILLQISDDVAFSATNRWPLGR